jgi:hypothetical protein
VSSLSFAFDMFLLLSYRVSNCFSDPSIPSASSVSFVRSNVTFRLLLRFLNSRVPFVPRVPRNREASEIVAASRLDADHSADRAMRKAKRQARREKRRRSRGGDGGVDSSVSSVTEEDNNDCGKVF